MTTKRGRSTYRPSSRPETLRERLGSRRRVLILVGLALFLIADVVLVGLALTANGRSTDTPTQRPVPTFGTSATATPEPTEEPAAAEETGRFLLAGSTDVLWRATEGTCDTPAVVERSTDGGGTWSPLPTATAMDLRVVHALTATGPDDLQLVGATGADCTVGGFTSADAGDTWSAAPDLPATEAYESAPSPDGSPAVVVDGQPVPAPCPAVEILATTADRTVVACSAVISEWDAETAFWAAIPFAGIHAVSVDADQILFAARGVPGCTGLGVLRVAGGALTSSSATENVGCVPDADVAAPAAMTSVEGSSWLWVGGAVLRSADGGTSWNAIAS